MPPSLGDRRPQTANRNILCWKLLFVPFRTIQIGWDLRANLNKESDLPDEELAEPVLARSKEEAEADDVADDTPEDDPIPENTWE